MKKGKEIELTIDENYSVTSGTVDNKQAKTVYVNISAWGQPKIDSEIINYDRVIRNLRKKVKQRVWDTLDPNRFYKDRTIVNLDMRSSGVNFNKRSFMSCEITLFQRQELPVNSKELQPILIDISDLVITSSFKENEYFTFFKCKK